MSEPKSGLKLLLNKYIIYTLRIIHINNVEKHFPFYPILRHTAYIM
jgi:hypothetical protein